jgi:ankyrin repeat protein
MRIVRLLLFVLLTVAAVSAQTDTSSALFAAIERGSTNDVERLLKAGANANAVDADGVPALMAAALFADTDMLDRLLARGADPNRTGPGGATALMWAAPDVSKMRRLIDHGANVNARSETDRTALLVAASYPGTVNALGLLVDHGADLRAEDRGGSTALALAIRSGSVDVAQWLVGRGLDPRALAPLTLRAGFARNDLPTTDYLLTAASKPGSEVFTAATIWQPADRIAHWIELGADVNGSAGAAQYSRTPLMNAVASEAVTAETVRLLLDRGADPNTKMTEGETSLDWAIYSGDRAKIQALEARGALRGTGPRQEDLPLPAAGGIADPRVSLTKSVARLLDVAPRFRDQAGPKCISCHHNALPALAAATAKAKGIDTDTSKSRKNLDDILTFFRTNAPRMMLGDPAVGGEALTVGYVQLALAANGHPLDRVTATMTHWVLARQMPDGRWLGNGLNRPPSEYSVVSHTAIAAGGLVAYPLPGRRKDIDESLRKARQWLLTADAKSAEERAMRLMGLMWTKAPRTAVSAAITAVRDAQEAGGGWSQFARTDADAYATGLSLYSLCVAGVPATDASYRKGVAFLLRTQYQDGPWLVRTHSFPVQRYFESGFPFGRHQWISTAGTSWASLAIAQTLPNAHQ